MKRSLLVVQRCRISLVVGVAITIASATPAFAAKSDVFFKPDMLESVLPPTIVYVVPPAAKTAAGFAKELDRLRTVKHIELLAVGKNVKAPVVIEQPPPQATPRGSGDSEAGVIAAVNAHGDVVALYVAYAQTREWAMHCLMAVARWKYRPATVDGQNAPALVCIPVVMHWQ